MESLIMVYITTPSDDSAHNLAQTLLEKRLIACANIVPVTSAYWWQGKIVQEKEMVLIGKTLEKHYAAVCKEVERYISYETPCIEKITVDANDAYKQWIINEVGSH